MVLLVIFALAPCADGRATLNRDRPNAVRVAGQVRVGGEGTVVRGARVTLLPTLETLQADLTPPCVETDRDGRYTFEGIAPGPYLVAASKTGFPRTAVVPVHVSAGRALDSVDVFLERGGAITGRISDENGDPLTGVVVEALNTMDQHGAMLRDFVRAGRSGTTDDRGEFRVFGLPPGMYIVEAAIGCPPRCIETHGVSTGPRYAYYPGVTERSEGRVIPVTAGQVVTGIDLTVALHRGFESRPDVVRGDKTSSGRDDMSLNGTACFMLGRWRSLVRTFDGDATYATPSAVAAVRRWSLAPPRGDQEPLWRLLSCTCFVPTPHALSASGGSGDSDHSDFL